jgi:phosphate-selective porin OprO/OprP
MISARAWSQETPTALVPLPSAETSSPSTPRAKVTVEQLAERLQAMEEMNRKLAEDLARTRWEHNEQMRQLLDRFGELSARPVERDGNTVLNTNAVGGVGPSGDRAQSIDNHTPVPDYTEGQLAPNTPAPGYPLDRDRPSGRSPLTGSFGPGFQFETEDEELRLLIHYESQIEGRVWAQGDQIPANSGFFLPRQRIFFTGNITKPIEYELSINRSSGGSLNLLNAYINVHFDDRFELKFGRFFTPLPYDQYTISNYWLPTPERSLFTTNVGLNRQFGLMGWGYLLDKRLDYAAGVFNGSRNSFENLNDALDFVAFLSARPFQESESFPFARFLNIGSSVAFGRQDQAPVPVSFRIGGASPNADSPGAGTTPFLILNRGVVERGNRLLGSVHAAYFHKGLSLIGEWQYGYGNYAAAGRPAQVQVPFSGFYVTGGYFLTGEHVERRTRVYPERPLVPTKKGQPRGPGAWEVVGRVSQLRLGEQIFSSGFADPSLWSNQATTTELGLNWYWNEYIKVYMFWLHGNFADPVQYRPGDLQRSADMFWLRFQLYF